MLMFKPPDLKMSVRERALPADMAGTSGRRMNRVAAKSSFSYGLAYAPQALRVSRPPLEHYCSFHVCLLTIQTISACECGKVG